MESSKTKLEREIQMDKNILMNAGVDYEEAVKRFSGNAGIYEKFLLKFEEDPSFQELDQAMKSQDYGTAFTAAHTLKGVSGNLSMNELYHELVPFVEMLRNGSDVEGAVEFYPHVANAYHELMVVLRDMK